MKDERIVEKINTLKKNHRDVESKLTRGELRLDDKRGYQGHSVSDKTMHYYEEIHNYVVDYK